MHNNSQLPCKKITGSLLLGLKVKVVVVVISSKQLGIVGPRRLWVHNYNKLSVELLVV